MDSQQVGQVHRTNEQEIIHSNRFNKAVYEKGVNTYHLERGPKNSKKKQLKTGILS